MPDFWDMDVGEVNEQVVVKREPIAPEPGMGKSSGKRILVIAHILQRHTMAGPVVVPASRNNPAPKPPRATPAVTAAPKQLPNGNYEYVLSTQLHLNHSRWSRCNHTCKDKAQCRHLWYVCESNLGPRRLLNHTAAEMDWSNHHL